MGKISLFVFSLLNQKQLFRKLSLINVSDWKAICDNHDKDNPVFLNKNESFLPHIRAI